MIHRITCLVLICTIAALRAGAPPQTAAGSYDALVTLFGETRASQRVAQIDGVPDYSTSAVSARRAKLDELGARLDAFDSRAWPIGQRVDHLLVLADWRAHDFELRVV